MNDNLKVGDIIKFTDMEHLDPVKSSGVLCIVLKVEKQDDTIIFDVLTLDPFENKGYVRTSGVAGVSKFEIVTGADTFLNKAMQENKKKPLKNSLGWTHENHPERETLAKELQEAGEAYSNHRGHDYKGYVVENETYENMKDVPKRYYDAFARLEVWDHDFGVKTDVDEKSPEFLRAAQEKEDFLKENIVPMPSVEEHNKISEFIVEKTSGQIPHKEAFTT